MPMSYREFKNEIQGNGHIIDERKKPHYLKISDKDGQLISHFALTHGKNTKRDEVKDIYIKSYRKAVKRKQTHELR